MAGILCVLPPSAVFLLKVGRKFEPQEMGRTLLLVAGVAGPSPAMAQFSALRPAAPPVGPAVPPMVPVAPPFGPMAPPVDPNLGLMPGAGLPQPNLLATKLGPLGPVLLYGIDHDYRGTVQPEGGYRLESKADEASVQFFYTDNPQGTYGQRQIRLNFTTTGPGSAGLIYGYQQDPTRYFLFLMDEKRTFRVLERTPEGFSEMINMSVDSSRTNELSLVENGMEVQVSLNGQNVLSLSNDRIGVGAVGLATVGAGSFEFQKFEIETSQR